MRFYGPTAIGGEQDWEERGRCAVEMFRPYRHQCERSVFKVRCGLNFCWQHILMAVPAMDGGFLRVYVPKDMHDNEPCLVPEGLELVA